MGPMKDKSMVPPVRFVLHGAYERQTYGSSSEICPSYSWVDRRLKKELANRFQRLFLYTNFSTLGLNRRKGN
jgi:hypothetical protein